MRVAYSHPALTQPRQTLHAFAWRLDASVRSAVYLNAWFCVRSGACLIRGNHSRKHRIHPTTCGINLKDRGPGRWFPCSRSCCCLGSVSTPDATMTNRQFAIELRIEAGDLRLVWLRQGPSLFES